MQFPAGRYMINPALAYECKPGKASFSEKVNKLLKPIETHKKKEFTKQWFCKTYRGFETSIQRLLSELDKLEKRFAREQRANYRKGESIIILHILYWMEISDTLEKFINVIQNSYKT